MDHNLVTTGFELSSFRIARHFGVVRGIIVRSRSVVGNIGAAFQQLIGGNISIYTQLCEQARNDAYELMIQHAEQVGANALVGVRYDATEIAPGDRGVVLWDGGVCGAGGARVNSKGYGHTSYTIYRSQTTSTLVLFFHSHSAHLSFLNPHY